MIVGVDFDNTIVCYDEIFHRAAIEKQLIPADLPFSKSNIRNYLRQVNKEDQWTRLQGLIYGRYIKYAPVFKGVKDFFKWCRQAGIEVYIVSHKTRYPFLGEKYDLHNAARQWMTTQGFFSAEIGLSQKEVYFELTKEAKLNRIESLECTHFIDDLPEFFSESDFPKSVEQILFDPNNIYEISDVFRHAASWIDIKNILTERSEKSQ
jgi:hypothetical protein